MYASQPRSQSGQSRLSDCRPYGSIHDALDRGTDDIEQMKTTFSPQSAGHALKPLCAVEAVAIEKKSDEKAKRQLYRSLSHQSCTDQQELARRKQIFAEVTNQFCVDELIEEFCGIVSEALPVLIQLMTDHRYVCDPSRRIRGAVREKALAPFDGDGDLLRQARAENNYRHQQHCRHRRSHQCGGQSLAPVHNPLAPGVDGPSGIR